MLEHAIVNTFRDIAQITKYYLNNFRWNKLNQYVVLIIRLKVGNSKILNKIGIIVFTNEVVPQGLITLKKVLN